MERGVVWTWVIKAIGQVLVPIVAIITDALREELETWVRQFHAKALLTENPWDDFLAEVLAKALGIRV